jgi:hypothetical protein
VILCIILYFLRSVVSCCVPPIGSVTHVERGRRAVYNNTEQTGFLPSVFLPLPTFSSMFGLSRLLKHSPSSCLLAFFPSCRGPEFHDPRLQSRGSSLALGYHTPYMPTSIDTYAVGCDLYVRSMYLHTYVQHVLAMEQGTWEERVPASSGLPRL